VKYVGEEPTLHLKISLEENYTISTEWGGKRYIRIASYCDYKQRQAHLSMPNYVKKTLEHFKHEFIGG
jgi:hypothetical protein